MTAPRRAKRAFTPAASTDVVGPVVDCTGGEVLPAPILLGRCETGDAVGIHLDRLINGRLLIQGTSGAGKSWLLRRLLETTASSVQQVVIDPEGEFGGLASRFGLEPIDGSVLDPTALKHVAARARQHQLSLWVDLSQNTRDQQMAAVAALVSALVLTPEDDRHSCLVVLDEADQFAPQDGGGGTSQRLRKSAIEALTDLMSRGRKRGLCGVLATQRLGKLSKSVAAEAGNVLIGRTNLDIDLARAADAIGWTYGKAKDRLPGLVSGDFVAVGSCFTRSPVVASIGPVQTLHRGSTPRIVAPPRHDDVASLLELAELTTASEARAAARHSGNDERDVSAVRAFCAEPGAAAAVRILEELRLVRPLPKLVTRLGGELDLRPVAVEQGLALLVGLGLVRFGVGASGRTVEASS